MSDAIEREKTPRNRRTPPPRPRSCRSGPPGTSTSRRGTRRSGRRPRGERRTVRPPGASSPPSRPAKAPVIVRTRQSTQATSSQPGAPTSRADSAEVRKMPEPIIEPMTIIVASIRPSSAHQLGLDARCPGFGLRHAWIDSGFSVPGDEGLDVVDRPQRATPSARRSRRVVRALGSTGWPGASPPGPVISPSARISGKLAVGGPIAG